MVTNIPKEYQLIDIPQDSTAYIFDIEADGFLEDLTKIHCVWSYSVNIKVWRGTANPRNSGDAISLEEHLKILQEADYLIGHNIIGYDIPAIQKVYPWFKPKGILIDTLIWSNLCYPNMYSVDPIQKKYISPLKRKLFKLDKERDKEIYKETEKELKHFNSLYGKHKMEAWGYRLGEYKGDFKDFSKWTPEMHEYCKQDVWVNYKIYEKLLERKNRVTNMSLWCEHEVKKIVHRQEQKGFLFDEVKAQPFYSELAGRRSELFEVLKDSFGDIVTYKKFTPKVNRKDLGYVKGQEFTKKIVTEFNPNSEKHIMYWLKKKYNWEPIEFTKKGNPKFNEEVIKNLPYPEAVPLLEYAQVNKILTMLGDGDKGWLKMVTKEGRIHGGVNTQGAGTGRMTHSNPNLAQIPKGDPCDDHKEPVDDCKKCNSYKLGKMCRVLFYVPRNHKLVGCDASGLELRCLAHYMNDSEYTKILLEGDIHSANQEAAGLPTRDNAKTFIYGFLYGAGNAKIGSIVGKGSKEGKRLKDKFLKGLPKLGRLIYQIKEVLRDRNYLKAIDGRRIPVRSSHSALNFLLQGLGALIMKYALVIADYRLQQEFTAGEDYEFVVNVHDEWQVESKEEVSQRVGEILQQSIIDSGIYLKLNCPLDGEFDIGNNWSETH